MSSDLEEHLCSNGNHIILRPYIVNDNTFEVAPQTPAVVSKPSGAKDTGAAPEAALPPAGEVDTTRAKRQVAEGVVAKKLNPGSVSKIWDGKLVFISNSQTFLAIKYVFKFNSTYEYRS